MHQHSLRTYVESEQSLLRVSQSGAGYAKSCLNIVVLTLWKIEALIIVKRKSSIRVIHENIDQECAESG